MYIHTQIHTHTLYIYLYLYNSETSLCNNSSRLRMYIFCSVSVLGSMKVLGKCEEDKKESRQRL